MLFYGILGNRGSGKTNLLTYFLYQAYLEGRPIFATYHLNFPSTFITYTQLTKMGDEMINAVVGLDEIGEGADAYDFVLATPRKISRFISQMRKLNVDAYYTDQRFNKVAKRLRDQTDYFVFMEDNDRQTPNHSFTSCLSEFNYTTTDSDLEIIQRGTFYGKPLQHLFNSREIVRNDN